MFPAVRDRGEAMLTSARFLAAVAAYLFVISGAWAQDKQLTPQQERMRSCNVEAGKKELKGEERTAFMGECLKGDKNLTAQQERMKSCNTQANKKELKGDERKAFMSTCLKGDEEVALSQQDRMRSCNEQAGKKDLKGDERRQFMSQCLKG